MSVSEDSMNDIRYTWLPVTVDGVTFVLSDDTTLGQPARLISGVAQTRAIYRWGFYESGRLAAVYIGETENLRQRVRGYLRPGPTQETNRRMNAEFKKAIGCGTEVRLETLNIIPVKLSRVHICNENLGDPFLRKMMENFVLADVDVVNCRLYNLALNRLERSKRKAGKNNPYLEILRRPGLDLDY